MSKPSLGRKPVKLEREPSTRQGMANDMKADAREMRAMMTRKGTKPEKKGA